MQVLGVPTQVEGSSLMGHSRSPFRPKSSFMQHLLPRLEPLSSVAMAAAAEKPSINLNEKVPSEDHLQAIDSLEPVPNASAGEARASLKATLAATTVELHAVTASPVNDVGRRMRRAERFGMLVQLSEEEKRSSRAERFGTETGANKSDVLGKSEDLKRKARAERFGMLTSSTPLDEEAKKKARSARFSGGLATDPQEEDKRKLRAIRFSDIPKTAIAGKASGLA